MPAPSRRTRAALWIVAPILFALLGAFVGAVIGMLIGDAMGHPEGEGFIGFIYGLWIGGASGFLGGALLAFARDRRGTDLTRGR
jgi:integral membrane sensor domain MASE1